jgi:prepilin-type processing-associated H-X9-DG protein
MLTPERPLGKRNGRWVAMILVLAFVGVFCGLLWLASRDARDEQRWRWCFNQLKQMGLGFHNYIEEHGTFPPAYLADAQGRPAHSWRVLLLPEIGYENWYQQFRLDEPWNSPHNLALAKRPSDDHAGTLYRCHTDVGAGEDDTSYVLIVGPGTAFEADHKTRLEEIRDGASHTLIAGEMSGSGIHWMEPRDLDFKEMSFKINDRHRLGLRSNHPGGAVVLFADGSTQFVSDAIDPESLKALITIAGGEPFVPPGS